MMTPHRPDGGGLTVHGFAARRFAGVRDAFVRNLEEHGDVGAACAVYRNGQPVVDLWAGFADLEGGRTWAEDTVQLVFSATKGVTAVCAHLLVERGVLSLDEPIAARWPEFSRAGKGGIPLRQALSHRAGLPAVEGDLSLADVLAWHPVVAAIAAQAPAWEPGTAHGYHVRSFGWIVGEVIRRATGKTIGAVLADEIARPLGLDCWIGAPEAVLGRCARIIPPENGLDALAGLLGEGSLTVRAMRGPASLFPYDDTWNRHDVLRAEMPSSNGVTSARALARLYAALVGDVDGIRLLAPETVAAASAVASDGPDRVLLLPTRFGLGFTLPPMLVAGCGRRAFGHPGAGGSLAFADPDARLGFGYVTTRMRLEPTGDPRSESLVAAVYGALA